MAVKRESGFPASSIGRSQGSRIQRTPSPSPSLTGTREVLTAHPLLSPSPSPAPAATTTSASPDTLPAPVTTTRYVPYTPRNRTAAATTGTTLQSSLSVSPQQGGGATSKLQLMNLKAYAQSVGLDTVSVGWEMLERLVGEHDHSPEWAEIWNALTTGKATLLLPLEQPHGVTINADFVKDHIVLCDVAPQDDAAIVTMSGLRGTLVNQTLTFRSSLKPGSKSYNELLNPSTRSSTLASLPPLPLISSSPLSQTYSTFTLPSYTQTLPLPPHVIIKPPLPPRPSLRPSSSSGTPSRLSSSLASLFSKQPVAPTPAPSPQPPSDAEHVTEVPAFTIDRHIVYNDVSRQINKALKAEIKEALTMSGMPTWVVGRVHAFTMGMYPFIKSASSTKRPFAGNNGVPPTQTYVIDPPQETAEEISQQFQDFYAQLEDEMFASVSPTTTRAPKGSSEGSLDEEHEKEKKKKKGGRGVTEEDVEATLEVVERVMCTMFYDRLYLQPQSDDGSHDEALSSRVAALNMLDLGLEHLGVDVGSSGGGIELVLKSCGDTLSQLDQSACRCPADKGAILVAAHKILVDGLSRLPPIRLKSEAELEHQKSPEATSTRFSNTDIGDENVDREPKADVRLDTDGLPLTTSTDTPPIIVSPDTETRLKDLLPPENEVPPSPSGQASPTPSLTIPQYRSSSPILVVSPPHTLTPVSGDFILPLMIYSVVKANPRHLVSHLLYTQRFRNQRFGGEESYCLVNLMAVADFLENVDLKALGLGESEKKVLSTADLTPIPVTRAALVPSDTPEGVPARLRRGVEQQVDAIAGSANKVILGVVDSSFGVLRSLLPGNATEGQQAPSSPEDAPQWNVRPSFGLLRRESGFSIASLAASLPGRDRARSVSSAAPAEESGQMMVEVSSRPGSIRSAYMSDSEGGEESDSDEEDGEEDDDEEDDRQDARSIRSFESMMKAKGRKKDALSRKSLSDRLASMPGLSRLSTSQPASVGMPQPTSGSPPPSRRTSLLLPGVNRFDTPVSSRAASPVSIRLAPPNKRFLECTEDDLKLSEVRELLREYRRMVEGVRAMGGFDE